MPAKVVDASAIAALLFGEPEADAVAAQLAGSRLVAPGLLPFELANVCLIKSHHRRNRWQLTTAGQAIDMRKAPAGAFLISITPPSSGRFLRRHTGPVLLRR
jgi:uncharacterized protein with PIN domain